MKIITKQDAVDETAEMLRQIAYSGAQLSVSTNDLNNLKKRKLVEQKTRKSYRIEKGAEFSDVRKKRYADISKEMLGNKEEVCVCSAQTIACLPACALIICL
jgi:hypothetical protein